MNHKHEAIWPLKHYKLYPMCTLILFNLPHLIVGSRLILIQNEVWVPNCCANFKVFYLCLGWPKDAIKILAYYVLYFLCITFFEQKWFTLSVISPENIIFIVESKGFRNFLPTCKGSCIIIIGALSNINDGPQYCKGPILKVDVE